MKRSKPPKRTTPIAPASAARRAERSKYNEEAKRYLAAHPYCQIFIFRHELNEEAVIKGGGCVARSGVIFDVPRSEEIHHRNKRNGERLLDQRWWMAACREQHDWVERNKSAARALGLLLPINAAPDGTWGKSNRGLETPALMAKIGRRS